MPSPHPPNTGEPNINMAAIVPAGSEGRHAETQSTAMPTASRSNPSSGTRRCFVCLIDEPKDMLPADWCTPCICSMQGHQACLRDWVASLEAQGKEIKCSVCKSPIHVSDPWSPSLQLNGILQRTASILAPSVLAVFFTTGLVFSSALYGIHAVEVFAGSDALSSYVYKDKTTGEAKERLLDRIIATFKAAIPKFLKRDHDTTQEIPAQHDGIDDVPQVNLFRFFSLVLVGPALFMNRDQGTGVIMVPSALVYAILFSGHGKHLVAWPPSPQVALAAFPTIKSVYFSLYRYATHQINKRLNATAHSRSDDQHDEAAAAVEDILGRDFGDDDNILDIQIDLQLGPVEQEDAPINGEAEALAPVYWNQQAGNNMAAIANYLAGTLMWPTLSFGMGTLLQHVLPRTWVVRPQHGQPTRLLQERWGRSLVGGCLLVVLKDTFNLYIKYRKAINRSRRIIKNVEAAKRHDPC